jgi:parallel beta-helix repeat protein
MSMPEIHVYPTDRGSDLAALQRAAEQQRQMRAGTTLTEPVRIVLHAGTYRLEAPIQLTPQDFGSVRAPVVWTTFGDGEVILTGSREMTASSSSGSSAQFPLELGTAITQVYASGRRLHPARFPDRPAPGSDGGWLYTDEPPAGEAPERKRFWCRDQGLGGFANIVGAQVRIYARHNFRCDSLIVTSYDRETGEIQVAIPATYEIDPGNRFYIEHLAEALDQPDEWWHDASTGLLDVCMPSDTSGTATIGIAMSKHIFEIRGDPDRAHIDPEVNDWPYWDDVLRTLDPPGSVPVSHVTISNLTLEGTSGTAIHVESCAALLIKGCTIRNTGNRGVTVIGGDSCKIVECEITHTSADGVLLAGGMRRPYSSVVVSSHHVITNCRVHHTGLDEKHVAAIALAGAGNRAEHCKVHDAPRWGINGRGNDHRIEYNEVLDVCQETSDCGAIYLCDRDWLLRGTTIRFNHVHAIVGFPYNDGGVPTVYGIYLDDWSSGVTVFGNLVHDISRAGIFVNSGHQNVVSNNIVVSNGLELANFLRWPAELEFERLGTDRHGFQKNRFVRNILVGTSGATAIYAVEGLIRSTGESELGENEIDHNLVWAGGGKISVRILGGRRQMLQLPGDGEDRTIDWESWRELTGQDANTIIADPKIDGSWQLDVTSPALAHGFEPLPIEQMGTYASEEFSETLA